MLDLDLIWFMCDIFQFVYCELKYFLSITNKNKRRPRTNRGRRYKNKKD